MSMDACAFRAITPSPDHLVDAPINPDWIVEGAPVARAASLSTPADDGLEVGTWDCTAGRFRWEFGTDEVIHVVDGMVRLTDESGRTVELRAGQVATFDAGDVAYWDVPEYVRKVWVTTCAASPSGRVFLKLRKVRRRVGVVRMRLAIAFAGASTSAAAGTGALLLI